MSKLFEKSSERRACFLFIYFFFERLCQNYLKKALKDERIFFYLFMFFERLLTIYCKEVIAASATSSDAADIFLALSHGMDKKLLA